MTTARIKQSLLAEQPTLKVPSSPSRSVALLAVSVLCIACASTQANTQNDASSVSQAGAVSDTSIFAPLMLPPAPSATRLANGAPGPKYWQNRADYDLAATLDTVAGTLQGMMTLRYTNNSPNTLDAIWLHMEQNRLRHDASGTPVGTGDSASLAAFGDVIDRFTQLVNGTPTVVQLEDHRTVAKVLLAVPLKPGSSTTFNVAWHFIIPPSTRPLGRRMGRRGSLYQMAQWYPRVAVYDDVKGWNIEPYLGQGEFFLEYGDFKFSVTVPSSFIVAATGTLDNPTEVLTPTEIARLALAAKVDTVVHIITLAELKDKTAYLKQNGMATWKFHANDVRDVAWCTSPHYQWDATHWKGILAQAYYRPPSGVAWYQAADMVRMSIQEYSERWYPYPYPQATAAEGPVNGMEYPMLSMDAASTNVSDTTDLYDVITHETGHNWFPMIVGSNERVHAWMDEGFNTFINTFSNARRYLAGGDQPARANAYRTDMETLLTQGKDERLDVPADSDHNHGYVAYGKPAGVLQLLRRDVMGPALFDKGFRTYIKRWAYKHPTPEDFYRTMDDAAGRRLDWFWREWFYEVPGFDQAIDSVTQATSGTETRVTVVYGNHARGVLPLRARFTFSDGTTQEFDDPADVWRANSTRYSASYTFHGKTVTRIELDPDHQLVDMNRANNVWPMSH